MTQQEIEALPVNQWAEDDCALFLWSRSPALPDALAVMTAWGFRYVTVAFNWVKIDSTFKPMMGVGSYTRPASELCLLGVRGKVEVADHGIHQVILAPRREHSRKPDDVYDRIERLFPKASYLEMFGRTHRKGWDVWGNQTDTFEDVSQRATLDDLWQG